MDGDFLKLPVRCTIHNVTTYTEMKLHFVLCAVQRTINSKLAAFIAMEVVYFFRLLGI